MHTMHRLVLRPKRTLRPELFGFLFSWPFLVLNCAPFHDKQLKTESSAPPLVKKETWDLTGDLVPKRCSLGAYPRCSQNRSANVSPKTAPRTGKIQFSAFLARFGLQQAPPVLQIPEHATKPATANCSCRRPHRRNRCICEGCATQLCL